MEAAKINFEEAFSSQELELRRKEPLSGWTTFRIGGLADYFLIPKTSSALARLHFFLLEHQLLSRTFLVGGGSNLLVSDDGLPIVVHPSLDSELSLIPSADFLDAWIPSSVRVPAIARRVSEMGFTGFEFLTTIPGEMGGAIVQNAGCYGQEIRDTIVEIAVVSKGRLSLLSSADADFSYRSSIFKHNPGLWIAGGRFRLLPGDPDRIAARINENREKRISSQPRNRRSAGSVFKNPDGHSAWKLIDSVGLRGASHGGALISPEHSNFIVNTGIASAGDVFALMDLIHKTVKERTGITLEREVVLAGLFPEIQ